MSELVKLIDEWRDAHGQPSEASVARAINAAPQTISSWRHRGIKDLPSREFLHGLAAFLGVPKSTVILAAARDAGYLDPAERGGDDGGQAAPMNPARDA